MQTSRSPLFVLLVLFSGAVFGADAPAKFAVSEFSFKPPQGWSWVEVNSPMRKAQLQVGQGKETAEVVFFYFGEGGAGGTQANVDRWLAQFQEPKDKVKAKVEKADAGKKQATFVQAEGTYMSGPPAGAKTPQPGSMLIGAILESPQGNVYVRMVGPKETVESARAAFRKMINDALAQTTK